MKLALRPATDVIIRKIGGKGRPGARVVAAVMRHRL